MYQQDDDPGTSVQDDHSPSETNFWHVLKVKLEGKVNCPPVTDLEPAQDAETEQLTLTWTAPTALTPEKYEILKDGESLGFTEETTFVIEEVSATGPPINYCVLPHYTAGACLGEPRTCEQFPKNNINENVKTSFSIAPNPAKNNITISASCDFNTIEIVNFIGQTILSQSNAGSKTTLDISNLADGVYFVRIKTDNGTSVNKFVKN